MSATETPAAPAAPPAERACPRCGAALAPTQDWCLSCGAAVTTRVEKAPGWQVPVAIVATVLLIAGGALLVAFLELSDDADRAARAPAATPPPAATPAPAATQPPVATATPTPTPAAPATATPTPADGAVASWPAGEDGWTIVLASETSEQAAHDRAEELAAAGTPAGVLHSDDFSSLRAGYWVVFSGQYDSSEDAEQAAEGLGDEAEGAYVRRVTPR